MSEPSILRLGTLKEAPAFRKHLHSLGLEIPCDSEILHVPDSPLLGSIKLGDVTIANRIAINPMEGWDGTLDGRPSEHTMRRWRRVGQSGAKLIWGGDAAGGGGASGG